MKICTALRPTKRDGHYSCALAERLYRHFTSVFGDIRPEVPRAFYIQIMPIVNVDYFCGGCKAFIETCPAFEDAKRNAAKRDGIDWKWYGVNAAHAGGE